MSEKKPTSGLCPVIQLTTAVAFGENRDRPVTRGNGGGGAGGGGVLCSAHPASARLETSGPLDGMILACIAMSLCMLQVRY